MTDRPPDPSRRDFLRALGRRTAIGAGRTIDVAGQLSRESAALAGGLLGIERRSPLRSSAEAADAGTRPAPGFRSPYLFRDDRLLILDQRQLPERRATVSCTHPSEVAAAIDAGAAGGGPVLAQVAAYALVLALVPRTGGSERAREAAFRGAGNVLRRVARFRAVESAVERLEARWDALPSVATGSELLAELRTEADRIAADAALDHAVIGRHAASALSVNAEWPLELLMHGDMGPLAGGLVGPGTAMLQALLGHGIEVHVWLPAGDPDGEGHRVAGPQLAALDIAHTVVDDVDAERLIGARRLDALVLRADRVYANGDCLVRPGSAALVERARTAGVPVYACVPEVSLDRSGGGNSAIPRSTVHADLDVVPAPGIEAWLTGRGVVRPPFDRRSEAPAGQSAA